MRSSHRILIIEGINLEPKREAVLSPKTSKGTEKTMETTETEY